MSASRKTSSEQFVRVEFYDHDYQDSNEVVEISENPTVLAVLGRVVEETDLFLVLSTCDTIQGEATRLSGAPMTVFRILKSTVLTRTVFKPKRASKK